MLYVVDTLRADAVGYVGNPTAVTPHLDHFARDALVFEQAYVASSWTRSSMASIFTGNHPDRHLAEDRDEVLGEASVTLAARLRDAGYATALLTANPNVGSFFGFAQGVDDTIELYGRRSAGVVKHTELVTRSPEITERAIAWIEQAPEPFFLAVLSVDPHIPYHPPEELVTGAERALVASRRPLPPTTGDAPPR